MQLITLIACWNYSTPDLVAQRVDKPAVPQQVAGHRSRMLDHLEQSGRERMVRRAVTVVSMPPSRRELDVPAIRRHFAARTRTVLLAPYEYAPTGRQPAGSPTQPAAGRPERVFDYSELVAGEIRGRWWNGKWGRMARRDIWLMYDGHRWLVRGREGGEEGREVNYQFDQEWAARAMVDRMMKASVGNWRDLTKLLGRESNRGHAD